MNNLINLVFITDDGYAMPTGVAITSLKINRNPEYSYHVYILFRELSDNNKYRLLSAETKDIKIIMIDIENLGEMKKFKKDYSRVTTTSIYKFYIPKVLENLEKVLYVDGDVIIQGDLVDLYNIEIEREYGAVIQDGPRRKIYNKDKRHAFSMDPGYFNSGVMLLNLKLLRQLKIWEKLMDYRINGYNYFMDQDAYNIVFKNHVKYISLYNNMLMHILTPRFNMNSIEEITEFYHIDKVRNKEKYFNKAQIIHYTFAKPWMYYDIPLAERWRNYFDISPFADIELDRITFLLNYHNSIYYRLGKKILFIPSEIYKRIKKLET